MTPKRFSSDIKRQAIDDYLNGMSYREVGIKYEVDHKTVRKWLLQSGNKSRSKEEAWVLESKKTKGQRRSVDTEFKKGLVPWNKDTVGIMKANEWSFKKGFHYSVDTEFKVGEMVGSVNPNWKGDDVGYYPLHSWVYRHKGRPLACEFCGSTDNLQWANKSFEYKRDTDDWLSLCCKCHRYYDMKNGWGLATLKYPNELKRKNS